MLHLAPVAAALTEVSLGRCVPRLLVGTKADEESLGRVLATLGADLPVERLPVPGWARVAEWLGLAGAAPKVVNLLAGWTRLRSLDAIVTAERTSTLVKRLPGRVPLLIHIPHGAGDRARGFERRISLFDHVIVAGEKDRSRMIDAGLVTPETCSISGYVKLAAVLNNAKRAPPPRLFGDDRPVILYNPHFCSSHGSWNRFARPLVRAVLEKGDANLIIAPHVRLAKRLSAADRAWLDHLETHDRVLVDLGSARSSDMTYTLGADMYVGDVSSQVYEFLHRTRPCVFLDVAGIQWPGDPNFAHWRFGEVVVEPAQLSAALENAITAHEFFLPLQKEGVRVALGRADGGAPTRAATIIADLAIAEVQSG